MEPCKHQRTDILLGNEFAAHNQLNDVCGRHQGHRWSWFRLELSNESAGFDKEVVNAIIKPSRTGRVLS